LLSDGYADLFEGGLRTVSAGWMIRRPGRGQLYLGYRNVEGPFNADLVNAAVDYRMSDKWIVKGAAQFDLGTTGNIGESVSLTRVGESLLIRVGANVNHSRDSYGLTFAIEPRFLGRAVSNSVHGVPMIGSGLNMVGGAPIPPAGMFGVE
ncbi:MAG: organic solvent tolerance protein OstA, partial [Planctomycetes bacterium]|nr:organic solvent tolerance protein OstA [Planctomycetota bacterium]